MTLFPGSGGAGQREPGQVQEDGSRAGRRRGASRHRRVCAHQDQDQEPRQLRQGLLLSECVPIRVTPPFCVPHGNRLLSVSPQGYSTPYPGLVRSPGSVGSEGRGEKVMDDDESVSSLIPTYLNSIKKLMID